VSLCGLVCKSLVEAKKTVAECLGTHVLRHTAGGKNTATPTEPIIVKILIESDKTRLLEIKLDHSLKKCVRF